jgi:hypothetical protein
MYRACSTWQYEVLSHLVETRLGGKRLGFVDGEGFARLRAVTTSSPNLGILKFHDADPAFAEALADGQAVAVYSCRDLRDVVFSFMHKSQLGFEELVGNRFVQRLLRNDRFWRAQPATLVQRYEAIQTDEVRGVRELAGQIGIVLSTAAAAVLADEFSWGSNLRRTQEIRRRAEADGLDLTDRENANRQDPVTLLHWNHLRETPGASWRDLATASQRETLAYLCGNWLIDHGYERDMGWVSAPRRDVAPVPEGDASNQRADGADPGVAVPMFQRLRRSLGLLSFRGPAATGRRPSNP